jgi:hypothetical protein
VLFEVRITPGSWGCKSQPNPGVHMKKIAKVLTLLFVPLVLILACSGENMDEAKKVYTATKYIPGSTWKKLAGKRIYFGHQSVGYNIVDGIRNNMKGNPDIQLNVIETDKPANLNTSFFSHSAIGQNFNPKSKCDSFNNTIINNLEGNVDIAFFKFCYVDFDENTDVDKVFAEYRNVLSGLKSRYPKTVFVNITAPLTTPPTGFTAAVKRAVKQLLGRHFIRMEDNIRREEFNEKLREECVGREPLFDLAKAESTFPDGTRASFSKEGRTYRTMVPEYTDDGGHLNEPGRKFVAEQLLIFLANLSN